MRMDMVIVKEATIQLGWQMSAQGHPQVFNERGNPYTTGQSVAGPKTTLYTGTVK